MMVSTVLLGIAALLVSAYLGYRTGKAVEHWRWVENLEEQGWTINFDDDEEEVSDESR
jgi:hypothetical protein|tara:strand:+ start:381 stop:554 length:174 start_codon:yes stop_codon:yes gene_type:complete